jgi:hypothetical protein
MLLPAAKKTAMPTHNIYVLDVLTASFVCLCLASDSITPQHTTTETEAGAVTSESPDS